MKSCTVCKEEKELLDFNKKTTNSDGLQNICRKCSNKKSKHYYNKDKAKHKANTLKNSKKRRAEYKLWVDEIKAAGCSCCEEKEVCCLDFHHLDPSTKEKAVAKLVSAGLSKAKIQEEIDKCILVCSNCHRKIHAGVIVL
tara:strand:+ start:652 stop:1071 length:420 start_codon:yes stop_codon:yes gene_type:complete